MSQAEFYRGVVSHKRWLPRPHGFAYELYMVLVDVDRPEESLSGLWPYASGSGRWSFSSFCESDHMKGHLKGGESLGDCVRGALRRLIPGYLPSAGSRVLLLTHLRTFGYTFNPISLYYVVSREGSVECMLAEVSNTPWNEMHLYPLHPGAPGVRAGLEAPGAPPLSRQALPPMPLSQAAQRHLLESGAVAPLDFDGLAARFPSLGPEASGSAGSGAGKKKRRASLASSASSSSSGSVSLEEDPPHLRYTWAKNFHVSPFFGMDHTYDWRFSQPNGSTLLVQSANWKDGERVFTVQLMLERAPLTRAHLAYMLFWAFPFLTFRIQWWIHYEAFRLWWRGAELFPHPTGARNCFVDTVECLVLGILATARLLSCCCGRGKAASQAGHSPLHS